MTTVRRLSRVATALLVCSLAVPALPTPASATLGSGAPVSSDLASTARASAATGDSRWAVQPSTDRR
jgi:hypothetical protein